MLLLGYVVLLVYGSLYPFTFTGPADAGRIIADLLDGAEQVSTPDVVVNAVAYAPIGAALALILPGAAAAGLTLIIASLLSLGMESLQALQTYRVASLLDTALNVGGALAGIAAGRLLRPRSTQRVTSLSRLVTPWLPRRPALVVCGLFILASAAPFIPSADLEQLGDSLAPLWRGLTGRTSISLQSLAAELLATLGLGFLLCWATPAGRFASLWLLVTLSLAGALELLVVTRAIAAEAVIAQSAALVLVWLLQPLPPHILRRLGLLALAISIPLAELALPIRETAAPMNWVPFRPHVLQPLNGIQDVLSTAWPFLALGLLLAPAPGPRRWLAATTLAGGCFLLEWAQRLAPGGYADITDALIGAVAGGIGLLVAWRSPPAIPRPSAGARRPVGAGAGPSGETRAHRPRVHG